MRRGTGIAGRCTDQARVCTITRPIVNPRSVGVLFNLFFLLNITYFVWTKQRMAKKMFKTIGLDGHSFTSKFMSLISTFLLRVHSWIHAIECMPSMYITEVAVGNWCWQMWYTSYVTYSRISWKKIVEYSNMSNSQCSRTWGFGKDSLIWFSRNLKGHHDWEEAWVTPSLGCFPTNHGQQ